MDFLVAEKRRQTDSVPRREGLPFFQGVTRSHQNNHN